MANYRLHPITWKNVIDYNWLQLQITITPCLSLCVKPLIHQSDLRTYTKVVPFQEKKFLSLWSIVTTTEWNGLIKIDNWS
jgi:hypothetical protein